MKMTKRILAILTALVLCLAPMILMVGAAEFSVYVLHGNCDCNTPGAPYGGTNPVFDDYVKQSYWCKSMYYTGGYYDCLTCGTKNEIVGYNQLIPHPTVYYEEDGSYWCPECGYHS